GQVVSDTVPLTSISQVRIFGRGEADTISLVDLSVACAIDGGAGSDTLKITGTSNNDAFVLQPGKISVNSVVVEMTIVEAIELEGGAGNDSLTGPNQTNTWKLTGADTGSVGAYKYASIENLVGGSNADSFVFAKLAKVTGNVNGQGGTDTLDYSDWNVAASVN